MCTTVVSIDPHAPVPVLMVGVRDEFLDRPWLPPGRHWPDQPQLVGGQDLQALGTWLAVHPGVPRVACVLNAHGAMAADSRRLTRGALPLRLAADGEPGGLDPIRYDPFHLVCATPDTARLWSWNGHALLERTLDAGLHVIVNSGLEGADDNEGPGAAQMEARIDYFRPLFEKAARPEPGAGTAEAAWGEWLPLARGGGLDPADPRALVLRGIIEDQRWGSSSVSLVSLTRTAVRYDFCANPVDVRPTWSRVL
jgi:hypothetical protein